MLVVLIVMKCSLIPRPIPVFQCCTYMYMYIELGLATVLDLYTILLLRAENGWVWQ